MALYMFKWHNDFCVRNTKTTYIDKKDGFLHFFCETHKQWAAELPVKKETIFTYENDATFKVGIERYRDENGDLQIKEIEE